MSENRFPRFQPVEHRQAAMVPARTRGWRELPQVFATSQRDNWLNQVCSRLHPSTAIGRARVTPPRHSNQTTDRSRRVREGNDPAPATISAPATPEPFFSATTQWYEYQTWGNFQILNRHSSPAGRRGVVAQTAGLLPPRRGRLPVGRWRGSLNHQATREQRRSGELTGRERGAFLKLVP